MRFYPSSYGTTRSATVTRRTREYNNCHDPKNGLFAPKGQGECDEGGWDDPGRTRAVYGQQADPKGALDLDKQEVTAADSWLEASDDDDERRAAKRAIAEALGPALEDHPDFEKFWTDFRSKIPAPSDGGGDDGEYDWDDDPLDLKGSYSSEYEDYQNQEMEEQDQAYRDEQHSEFKQQRQKTKAAIAEKMEGLKEIWEEAKAEVGPYGDVSEHPNLPGLEDVDRSGKHLDAADFFRNVVVREATEAWAEKYSYSVTERLLSTEHWDGRDWQNRLDELDLSDPEVRGRIKDAMRGYTRSDILDDMNAKLGATFVMESHSIFGTGDSTDEADAFDRWYEEHGGEPDYNYKTFEEWYVDEHGEPSTENDGGDDVSGSTRGEAAASWLIKQWAETSGDGSPDSVMLQAAANKEFKLGATYTGQFQTRGADRSVVDDRLRKHGPLLQSFLRTMYDHTQAELKKADIEYVTLYRGFSLSSTKEKGLSTVNKAGEFVDVLMQPMSSFSTNFDTAQGFGGTSTSSFVMGVRVHRSQIIGTARTGFGCLNEHEWVLLGGRQPAYVIAPYSDEAKQQHGAGQTFNYGYSQSYFWKGFEAATRRRKSPLTSGGVVVGPGDRL